MQKQKGKTESRENTAVEVQHNVDLKDAVRYIRSRRCLFEECVVVCFKGRSTVRAKMVQSV